MTEIGATQAANPDHLLEKGERVLWRGQPSGVGLMRAMGKEGLTGITLLFFSWLSLQAAMQGAVGDGQDVLDRWAALEASFSDPKLRYIAFIGAFVLPFALWMASTPLRALSRAKAMTYLVTDRRILILHKDGLEKAFGPNDLIQLKVNRNRPGGGDVIFIEPSDKLKSLTKKHFSVAAPKGFFGLEDPQAAASAIEKMAGG